MEITPFELYCILTLDSLHAMLVGITALLFIATIGCFLSYLDDVEEAKPWIMRSFILLLTFAFLTILIPSTKQAAMLLTVPAILSNEDVQKIPVDLVKLARQEIEKLLENK